MHHILKQNAGPWQHAPLHAHVASTGAATQRTRHHGSSARCGLQMTQSSVRGEGGGVSGRGGEGGGGKEEGKEERGGRGRMGE